jgi:transposase InsO family protein
MSHDDTIPMRTRWARLRFSIIGPLLAAPPEPGELAQRLQELSGKHYQHPSTKERVQFGASTIERWYYAAREQQDPLGALERKVPAQAGTHPSVSAAMQQAIRTQYQQYPSWSYKLHYDNLETVAQQDPALGKMPSYPTVRRYMKDQGLLRLRSKRHTGYGEDRAHDGQPQGPREKRSYEVSRVHQMWHLDFHVGSRKVLTAAGQWQTPVLLGILDDHSRLCCHLQWYLAETAECLVHGLCQALAKRGMPRALMTDNGAAMVAQETQQGLERLGIVHYTTLPYTPEQNAKQECFWAQVEGRLMAMLKGEPNLTLSLLNEATQAWAEHEYQCSKHSELGESPISRALRSPTLVRPSPSSQQMQSAFRMQTTRAQRLSDGTFTFGGVRFEVPSAYRTLTRLCVRVARWDKSSVELCDPRTGAHLCMAHPVDKNHNADRRRRALPQEKGPAHNSPPPGIAPRLRALMQQYAQTGLPPAYLPKDDTLTPGREQDIDKELP